MKCLAAAFYWQNFAIVWVTIQICIETIYKAGMARGFFNLGPGTHMSGQIGVVPHIPRAEIVNHHTVGPKILVTLP